MTESLTFFRATNSFSAVALSATSSSYLWTEGTGTDLRRGKKKIKDQMDIPQDLTLWRGP